MAGERSRAAATLPWLVAVAGVVLTVVGVWLLTRPVVAWFAYAPLSGDALVPSPRPSVAGIVALGLGCALWGGALGALLARRRARAVGDPPA
ncbi:hypothetical protein [Cellulomonas sp. GbtcB1]|uniref:hypothetical protein n=1 Tax=Cellulomonas sp. GbtcB1 TaxID=2824746 RepID=UPI001C2F1A63|nr:hypothetical protein [Cellulomonas sp. GbtcB1]